MPPNQPPGKLDAHPTTSIINSLATEGYAVCPAGFLSESELLDLDGDFVALANEGAFKNAGVGKGENKRLSGDIRRDQICWFEPTDLRTGQNAFWQKLMELKEEINQAFYLGLWSLEGHFAHYPSGGFYRRHLDRFSNDDLRTVTVVYYLNENWKPGDGGELVIYPPPNGRLVDQLVDRRVDRIIIEPRRGTIVVFMSAEIEHEVLESKTDRKSFAGWFRRR
jgi:SM-20-related protein